MPSKYLTFRLVQAAKPPAPGEKEDLRRRLRRPRTPTDKGQNLHRLQRQAKGKIRANHNNHGITNVIFK